MVELDIDTSVRSKWLGEVVLASFSMEGLSGTRRATMQLDFEIESLVNDLKALGKEVLDEPTPQRMRTTFRAMPDMDPARYRPASEALIRRCLDKGLFRISPLVDVNNLLSVRLRIPLGIYALDQLDSTSWVYRVGYPNETYLTISNQQKNADGKLVVADPNGVMGSPVSDSGRAAIHQETDRVMVIAYFPIDTKKSEAEKWIQEIDDTFKRFFVPKVSSSQVLFV
jgi:DNA/RNA-binding domain of Phe-tRNA-synthetase-like protein